MLASLVCMIADLGRRLSMFGTNEASRTPRFPRYPCPVTDGWCATGHG